MTKRNLRKTAALLAAISLFSCGAGACKKRGNGEDNGYQSGGNTVTIGAADTHVSGTLHKVNVTENENRIFAKNGVTQYKIAVTDDVRAKEAANFIAKHVYAATGANLEIVASSGVTYEKSMKYIVIGDTALFAAAGLTMPSDDLGQTGYYIKTAGDSVFLAVYANHGYQQAALCFLRQTIGYDMFSADMVVYEKSGETLPDMDITERPDFEFHRGGNGESAATAYGMGFNLASDIFIKVQEYWHNTMYYLPYETYGNKDDEENYHPEWYAAPGVAAESNQICATAHGNAESLKKMEETVADTVYKHLEENPDRYAITFTVMDNNNVCKCEACTAEREKYGTDSAAYIKLVNNVSDEVDKRFEKEGKRRDYMLMIFAYQITAQPPAVKQADGTYKAVAEEMKLHKNVGVYIAPSTAEYTYSFYDAENAATAQAIEGWAALTDDNIFFWLYETYFGWYYMPYNSFDSIIDTYRYCYTKGNKHMNNLGQYYGSENPSCFMKFKAYLDSKAEFDVNVEYEDVKERFFGGYFRDAAEPMLRYFNELTLWLRQIENENDEVNGQFGCTALQNEKYWPKGLLNRYLSLIDEAYAAIEKYKISDPGLYEKLYNHINAESLFPRYAVLEFYKGTFSADALLSYRIAFRDDIRRLNNSIVHEWNGLKGMRDYTFEDMFKEWGIA